MLIPDVDIIVSSRCPDKVRHPPCKAMFSDVTEGVRQLFIRLRERGEDCDWSGLRWPGIESNLIPDVSDIIWYGGGPDPTTRLTRAMRITKKWDEFDILVGRRNGEKLTMSNAVKLIAYNHLK